ncbi:MAG TPA: type VI secretion system accessory protein TagJ [Allosphingosinicella sp.]
MQNADERLREGDLEGARAALTEKVRASPGDPGARMFLFQLLCVTGEWEKARKQLETLAQLSPEARMLSVVYGQAIAAEALRADVFAGRAAAPVLAGGEWTQGLSTALHLFAVGETAAAGDARDSALDQAPDTPGHVDGTRFDWIADADSRFGPCFEAIVGGRYGLIAFDAVERIESEGPRDLRDIVWCPVQVAFRQGTSVAAFLPVRYPGTENSSDDVERLARSTGWHAGPDGETGSGQHVWMLSDGEERGLLSMRSLSFD